MNRLNQIQDLLNSRASPFLGFLRKGPVNIVLTLTLVMYAANFVPRVPDALVPLFDNVPFKILYLALTIYLTGIDAGMAILMGLAAYATFSRIRGQNAVEAFTSGV